MGESFIETISKLKIVGYFLAFWGVTFLFRGLSDITYYAYNYGTPGFNEAAAETAFYLINDAAMLAAGIALWILAVKIIKTKKTPAPPTPNSS